MNQLTPEQLEWCDNYLSAGSWKVNSEGLVDVEGDVYLRNQEFQHLPVAFGKVSGLFDLEGCKQLLILEGSPRKVGEWFDCKGCTSLQTLVGAPLIVRRWFRCDGCTGLQSLEGAPQSVGGRFWCEECTGLPEWMHGLVNDFNEKKISWEEFLQLNEKFLQNPKLVQAKNLGLF